MLTIKYTDLDGIEHLTEGKDIRAKMDGKQALCVSWVSDGVPAMIRYPSTVYVVNDGGATVAKYVVIGEPVAEEPEGSGHQTAA